MTEAQTWRPADLVLSRLDDYERGRLANALRVAADDPELAHVLADVFSVAWMVGGREVDGFRYVNPFWSDFPTRSPESR